MNMHSVQKECVDKGEKVVGWMNACKVWVYSSSKQRVYAHFCLGVWNTFTHSKSQRQRWINQQIKYIYYNRSSVHCHLGICSVSSGLQWTEGFGFRQAAPAQVIFASSLGQMCLCTMVVMDVFLQRNGCRGLSLCVRGTECMWGDVCVWGRVCVSMWGDVCVWGRKSVC